VERAQLVGGDVHALDLAAVVEVAHMLRVGGVESLAVEQRGQLRLRFAAQARGFLLLALGADALVLLALGAYGIRLGEVDVALRPALARAAARALLRVRRAPAR